MDHVAQTTRCLILSDDDPRWDQHSGLDGHRDHPEWTPHSDLDRARVFYQHVYGKAAVFLDILIDNPGARLSVEDICAKANGAFTGPSSLAGSITGLHTPHVASGRRYPFYWWQEQPTRYAMKKTVAALFRQARTEPAK
jgi:hypothetical protein